MRKGRNVVSRTTWGYSDPGFSSRLWALSSPTSSSNPPPPKKITIATGDKSGAYYAFGQRYREILARDGITLEIRSTAGSVENVKLLETPSENVDVAFVQGGIGDPGRQPGLQSLASLYFEPLWVFHRLDPKIKRLSDLKGKRIAVGAENSGTKAIATKLLEANGVTEKSATLLSFGAEKARDSLIGKKIDAAFFVLSPQAPLIQNLLLNPSIRLHSFERGDAYQRANRFLSIIKMPEGVMNFEKNIPDRDTLLLAPAATLVVREGFHPALVDLLLDAAVKIHSEPGLFQELHEFPSQKYLDFPLQKDAERYFRSGPPFLKKYLPFWAAVFLERIKVMLLPLMTLLIPLIRFLPPGFRWKTRSRIYHWYRDLEDLEYRGAEAKSLEEVRNCFTELEKIDRKVMHVTVPLSYAGELYNLRSHIDLVKEALGRKEVALNGEFAESGGNAKS